MLEELSFTPEEEAIRDAQRRLVQDVIPGDICSQAAGIVYAFREEHSGALTIALARKSMEEKIEEKRRKADPEGWKNEHTYLGEFIKAALELDEVTGCLPTTQYGDNDRKGIDVLVQTSDGDIIGVGVTGTGSARRKREKNHPKVPQVSMRDGEPGETKPQWKTQIILKGILQKSKK